jgi:arabinosaccharide transport system substrate-binding protein
MFSLGAWLIIGIAVVSTMMLAMKRPAARPEATMWTFARMHALMYEPLVKEWNAARAPRVELLQLGLPAIERRMLASFFSGTPCADLMEVERRTVARAFAGPIEAVGFVDLTDRLRQDGLLEKINGPSFSPWSSRGRVFGLPHDVHPVMLGYRADIVEAAGIDVSKIETWDDFERVMRPLQEMDEQGVAKRFALSMWETHGDHLEVLILQAGGTLISEEGEVTIDSEINRKVLMKVSEWCAGPNRIAMDAPNFTASGNQMKVAGKVICAFMPDWMGDVWKHEMPELAGKIKLMPLPAWEKGGRRTSVWGGTMLGIPKAAATSPERFEQLYAFASHLYLSQDVARELYRKGGIITPVKAFWNDPIYDQPDAFFAGQAPGRAYINLAGDVPLRSSSPFNARALDAITSALVRLCEERRAGKLGEDGTKIAARASELLADAQKQMQRKAERNVFLSDAGEVSR